MRPVGQLALAQSRASRAVFSSSYEVSSVSRALDVWMITGSVGSPTVAVPPAVVSPVADPPVYIMHEPWFTNELQTKVGCDSLLGDCASRVYPLEPLLFGGNQFGLGGVLLRLVF